MPDLVTIEGVEIGSVGMKWHASNGDFTLTAQHLQDVMRAANDDPHITTPRLKLGHEGWPENDGLDNNPFGTSAEPALGRAVNFRLTNDGATLIADYVDVPAWLPAAYPGRSGEWLGQVDPVIAQGVTTPGGKHYSMVLTAVALLGVCAPAISDLEDLESFVTTGTTKAGQTTVTPTQEATVPQPAATRADIDTVQRSFWSEFATGDRFWWWPRDIYTDPNEVLADDDEGHLFRVPFTSGDDGDVEWGDPTRVRIDLVDLPDLQDTVATVAASLRAVRVETAHGHRYFATATAARPAERTTQRAAEQVSAATNQADTGHETEEVATVAINVPALRERLGLTEDQLPDDATEEQVNAILAETSPDTDTPDEPDTDTDGDDTDDEPDTAAEVEEPEPIAAQVELLKRQNAELLADKQRRDEAAATAAVDERVEAVKAACTAGVLKPHEVDTWTERVKDPAKGEAWATVLRDMAPTFGTSEIGADADAVATVTNGDGPLPDNVSLLTPVERAQRAAA